MRSKIFKIKTALLLLLNAMPFALVMAQAVPLAPPTKPVPPVLAEPPLPPSVLGIDSDYQNKIKELSLKMRELQKQMSKLHTEEMKKQMLTMQDFSSKQKQLSEKFSKEFNYNFKAPDVHINMDMDWDKQLNEKIKSGQVKEKTKSYSKSYNINKGDLLEIDNRFGKVTINTWTKNEFKVDVEIKAMANDDEATQKILDGVTIGDSKDGSTVSFKTNIESNGNNSWGMWTNGGESRVHKVEVNYTVYMPVKNPLTITNRYGGTVLPDFDGKVVLNNSYGSISAKHLTNPDNEITSRYGSANIEGLTGSDLKVSYGSLMLGTSDKLNADISYSSAKIGKIKTSGNLQVRYSGGLMIGDLDKNLKSLTVNSSYSSLSVGLNENENFDFDVTVSYGSFNYGDHNINVVSKTPEDGARGWNPTKTYKGHLGKGSTDKLINITSHYGSVKFNWL
jgi:hypothetical protein